MSSSILRSGSCLCRRIRFTLTGDPYHFVICHCINCQKMAGGAFMANLWFKEEQITVTQGKEVLKTYGDQDTKSGRTLNRSFCSECGSSLFLRSVKGYLAVAMPSVEGKHDWVPTKENLPEQRCGWVKELQIEPRRNGDTERNKL